MDTGLALLNTRDAFAAASQAHAFGRTTATQDAMNAARLRFAHAVLDYAAGRPVLIDGRGETELRALLDADVDANGYAGSTEATDAIVAIDRAGWELARQIERQATDHD